MGYELSGFVAFAAFTLATSFLYAVAPAVVTSLALPAAWDFPEHLAAWTGLIAGANVAKTFCSTP